MRPAKVRQVIPVSQKTMFFTLMDLYDITCVYERQPITRVSLKREGVELKQLLSDSR